MIAKRNEVRSGSLKVSFMQNRPSPRATDFQPRKLNVGNQSDARILQRKTQVRFRSDCRHCLCSDKLQHPVEAVPVDNIEEENNDACG